MAKRIFAIVFALLLFASPLLFMGNKASATDGMVVVELYAVVNGKPVFVGVLEDAVGVVVIPSKAGVVMGAYDTGVYYSYKYPGEGNIIGLAETPYGSVVYTLNGDVDFTDGESVRLYMIPEPDVFGTTIAPFLADFTDVFLASLPFVNGFYFGDDGLTIAGAAACTIAATIVIAMIIRWLFRFFGKRK